MNEMSRKKLLDITAEYLEAITDNDTSRLPLAKNLKVTDNGKKAKIASGDVWGTPRRIPFRQTFVDPQMGEAVFFGVVTNSTTAHGSVWEEWWYYLLRLKIEDNLIAEMEEIYFNKKPAHFTTYPWEMRPNRAFDFILPPDEQAGRAELINIVDAYWDANERSIDVTTVPFHPDMQRSELGTITTNAKNFFNSSRGDFTKEQNAGWQWEIVNRRYPIVDTQRGLVVSFVDFKNKDETNPDFSPAILAEVFKIECGHIRDLFALYCPGLDDSGW
jgi:hypothetical protein